MSTIAGMASSPAYCVPAGETPYPSGRQGAALITTDVVVLLFGGASAPRPLVGLEARAADGPDDIDAAACDGKRLIVVGTDADLASVLTRLLRTDRLDVEVGHATGWWAARRARRGTARRVPLIRDDTGHVLVRAARMAWAGRRTAARRGGRRRHPAVRRRGHRRSRRADAGDAWPAGVRYSPRQNALGGRAGRSTRHHGRGRGA